MARSSTCVSATSIPSRPSRRRQPKPRTPWRPRRPTTGPWEGPYRLRVELSVAEWTKTQWTLRYTQIRRIFVDFPTDTPLFYNPGDGFEDWGYHELSDAGDGFLRHEILFSSGAVVLVEFRDVSVERVDRPTLPTAP
jgi:hypothetical protein